MMAVRSSPAGLGMTHGWAASRRQLVAICAATRCSARCDAELVRVRREAAHHQQSDVLHLGPDRHRHDRPVAALAIRSSTANSASCATSGSAGGGSNVVGRERRRADQHRPAARRIEPAGQEVDRHQVRRPRRATPRARSPARRGSAAAPARRAPGRKVMRGGDFRVHGNAKGRMGCARAAGGRSRRIRRCRRSERQLGL